MNFGKVLREDVDEERNQLKRMVSKTIPATQGSMESHPQGSCGLTAVAVKSYRKETQALLNTSAVPNLMSWDFCGKL